MLPVVEELAKRVHVPVALNLDHGSDFYVIADCINAGFTNVMFDGSSLPYEENVKRTAIVSALAHGMAAPLRGSWAMWDRRLTQMTTTWIYTQTLTRPWIL